MITFGDEQLPQRFWDKIEVDPVTGCWNWTAAKIKGYGRFKRGGQMRCAHRESYSALVEQLPDRVHVDHTCCNGSNRRCVHPEHLEPVTLRENFRRGSNTRGERKIRCSNGHPATAENTYIWHNKRSGRDVQMCRSCQRAASRRHYHVKRAAA